MRGQVCKGIQAVSKTLMQVCFLSCWNNSNRGALKDRMTLSRPSERSSLTEVIYVVSRHWQQEMIYLQKWHLAHMSCSVCNHLRAHYSKALAKHSNLLNSTQMSMHSQSWLRNDSHRALISGLLKLDWQPTHHHLANTSSRLPPSTSSPLLVSHLYRALYDRAWATRTYPLSWSPN